MKKEIREVKDGIVRVTTVDERWYARPTLDSTTGLPTYQYVPSVTWIAEHYPKGIGFYKWLANTGWDEAQALKEAAGGKGSKVHQAIVDLLDGHELSMEEATYLNPSTEKPEALTVEECVALFSFQAWYEIVRPISKGRELVVWNDEEGYAGTVDFLCEIDGALWIIDFKTSKSIWPSHRMQVSAYKHALSAWTNAKLGILQVGYERNKIGYRFTEIEDCYPLFLSAKQIWAEETKGQQPAQRDYPLIIRLEPAPATTPTTAQASPSNGPKAMPTTGGKDGRVGGVGEEKLQDADLGRRGVGGSRVRRVQDRGQSVRS